MSPTPRKRRRLSPEERRAELLLIGMDVFATMGVARAGHGDIARVANVSTATVFNYFPTRDDLVRAILEECKTLYNGMIKRLQDDPEFAGLSPRHKIFAIALAFEALIETRPDATKVYLNWSTSFDPDTRPLYLDFLDHVMKTMMALAPRALTTLDDARILMGASNMITQMKLDGVARPLLESFIVRLTNNYLQDI